MNRRGSFVGLLSKTLMQALKILFVVGQIVFWLLLFVLSALLEVLMRSLEVLELVKYVDMEQGEPIPKSTGSCVVVNGKPKASVIALQNKYVDFDLKIKMPYRQSKTQSESRPE